MKSDKHLWNVCKEIYQKIYEESTPSLDFKDLLDKFEKDKIKLEKDWFMKHYLSQERQVEIMEEVCKKYKITKLKRKRINFEIFLGCAPSRSEKDEK